MSHYPKQILSSLALGLFLSYLVCPDPAEGGDLMPAVPSHHTGNGYRNNHIQHDTKSLGNLLKWRWEAFWKDIPPLESYDFPLAENDTEFLRANRTQPAVTWIGHATLLVQIGGKNILTDPHFSERASPVQWAGPKRAVPPGVPMDDLPAIDAVLLSHDHYDSLDDGTMRKLAMREGADQTTYYVPLGFRDWFEARGIRRVVELDWWQSETEGGMTVTAVPMQHWSKRTPFSKNGTLWAGWVVEVEGFRFFFVGDSGYGPHFKEIGDRLGPFDLSAIPIGAYEPRWFMKPHHMNPEESVRVHQDVRSRKSVAMHWGTFALTDEPLDEPPRRLQAAVQKHEMSVQDFIVLRHGETVLLESGRQAGP